MSFFGEVFDGKINFNRLKGADSLGDHSGLWINADPLELGQMHYLIQDAQESTFTAYPNPCSEFINSS